MEWIKLATNPWLKHNASNDFLIENEAHGIKGPFKCLPFLTRTDPQTPWQFRTTSSASPPVLSPDPYLWTDPWLPLHRRLLHHFLFDPCSSRQLPVRPVLRRPTLDQFTYHLVTSDPRDSFNYVLCSTSCLAAGVGLHPTWQQVSACFGWIG